MRETDRFEATFIVEVPLADAWERFASHRRHDGDAVMWQLPVFEASASEIECVAEEQVRLTKEVEPCKGTEIVVRFEQADSGTKVTLVQSGFGQSFHDMFDALSVGWGQIVADFAAYLERGVVVRRYASPWAWLGAQVDQRAAGLEVVEVSSNSFAERAGLVVGDVLVTVGRGPIVDERDLLMMMKVYSPGTELEATWIRDAELMGATAAL